MTDSGRLGCFHRLHMLETAKPNPFIDDVVRKIRQPHREQLFAVLRELLGARATDREVERCETSVIGQCLSVSLRQRWQKANGTAVLTPQEARAYADHIARFSLAGIAAVRQDWTPDPPLATGISASSGVASGKIALNVDRALQFSGKAR